jgi:hypothetical protein
MIKLNNYIPILKWKRAEQDALSDLELSKKKKITPLIQLVMPRRKDKDSLEDVIKKANEQIMNLVGNINKIWGDELLLIDTSLLYTLELKTLAIEKIVNSNKKNLIPVIYLNDDIKIINLASKSKTGLCLRLTCSNFKDPNNLDGKIEAFLKETRLNKDRVDLLVDIKETENDSLKYNKYFKTSQRIKGLKKWRSFIFSSGSFPKDMSEYSREKEDLLPRIDWISWKNILKSKRLKRIPLYSDYTIQHPVYEESTQFFPPTTTIKYTLKESWLILKGKKQRFDMYLAYAALLIENPRYFGENYSQGDAYIKEKGQHFPIYSKDPSVKGTGNTETWLRAGINHHLTLTANQVSNYL